MIGNNIISCVRSAEHRVRAIADAADVTVAKCFHFLGNYFSKQLTTCSMYQSLVFTFLPEIVSTVASGWSQNAKTSPFWVTFGSRFLKKNDFEMITNFGQCDSSAAFLFLSHQTFLVLGAKNGPSGSAVVYALHTFPISYCCRVRVAPGSWYLDVHNVFRNK